MFENLAKAGKYLGQAARLMVGVPDYDTYVQHIRLTHPEQTPMSYEEFYRERVEARYGGKNGSSRCC
ncbi:YbdD/YjiX family protein [Sulfurospirillum arsenophilum]|uniref:YbdD/YjiX family protein n=1 Tax=Sulfurospirillum arsenophilum TaxID=56698 RepID=UPI0005A72BC2|nr:YbdD/YjiX family protein [Sulfurospirillum arsenophilum]